MVHRAVLSLVVTLVEHVRLATWIEEEGMATEDTVSMKVSKAVSSNFSVNTVPHDDPTAEVNAKSNSTIGVCWHVGCAVRMAVGTAVVGTALGVAVEGTAVEGICVGASVGVLVGAGLGFRVGCFVGRAVEGNVCGLSWYNYRSI